MKKYDDAVPMGKERPSWTPLLICVGILAVVALLTALDARDDYSRYSYRDERELPLVIRVAGFVILSAIGALVVAGAGVGIHRMYQSSRERAHEFRHKQAVDQLALREREERLLTDTQRAKLSAAHMPPYNEHGRLGALVRETGDGWQILNLDAEQLAVMMHDDGTVTRAMADRLSLAQLLARQELEEERAKASAHPQLHTYHSLRQNDLQQQALAAPQPAAAWPRVVRLHEIAPDPASIHRLALGVTVNDAGQQSPVTAALSEMVHIAVGGSSGWGKSIFLKALALQLATAAEPVHLAMVDLEGVTFSAFATCGRLLWPVAETEGQALAIMALLVEEMDRRSLLFREFPGVDSLAAYNARAGDEPLIPVVALIDEATALLSDRGVQGAMRTLVLRARKYGLWMVLGGQDWKAASIDSAIRNQLSSRIQFRASDAAQSRTLLGDGAASTIEVVGRAYAQLPGRPMLQIMAPLVSGGDIGRALAGQGGPAGELPEAAEDGGDQDARIRELAGGGRSLNAIQREVFGYIGGAAYEAVKRVLGDTTITGGRKNGGNGEGG